jgi:hypothetical protein
MMAGANNALYSMVSTRMDHQHDITGIQTPLLFLELMCHISRVSDPASDA